MWYVLGFLLLLAIGQAIFYPQQSGDTVSYSEFKQLVRDGKVQEVTVGEDRIRGKQKAEGGTGRSFTVVMIEDPKLVEDLDRHGVKFTGEIPSRWIGEVLGWVIP